MLGRVGLAVGPAQLIAALLAALMLRRTRLLTTCLLLAAAARGLWRATVWTGDQHQLASLIGQAVTATGTLPIIRVLAPPAR